MKQRFVYMRAFATSWLVLTCVFQYFYFRSTEKTLDTVYFYLSIFFGEYFYLYLSNKIFIYLYFYLSTELQYFLQHWQTVRVLLHYPENLEV